VFGWLSGRAPDLTGCNLILNCLATYTFHSQEKGHTHRGFSIKGMAESWSCPHPHEPIQICMLTHCYKCQHVVNTSARRELMFHLLEPDHRTHDANIFYISLIHLLPKCRPHLGKYENVTYNLSLSLGGIKLYAPPFLLAWWTWWLWMLVAFCSVVGLNLRAFR